MSSAQRNATARIKPLWMVIAVIALGVAVVIWALPRGGKTVSSGTTFEARRGLLEVVVLAGGGVEALESQEIRSAIKGRAGIQILDIVEEGYLVTEEDVESGLTLVALDSADLEDRLIQQEIGYESAYANFIESKAAYDIQLNQNKSNITAAELIVKFARMDLKKYLGEAAVAELIDDLGLDERAAEIARLDTSQAFAPAAPRSAPMLGPSTARGENRRGQQDARPRGPRGGSGDSAGWRSNGAGGGLQSRAGSGQPSAPRGGPSIALDDELIEAISREMSGKGMPFEPERFKQMLKARGGEGPLVVTPEMAQGMQRMGVDVYEIARGLGKGGKGKPATALAPEPAAAPFTIEVDSEYLEKRASIDFSAYADVDKLEDGEAKQELRRLEGALVLAAETLKLAESDLEAMERLVAREFETQTNLDRQKLAAQGRKIDREFAEIDQALYIKYSFPKEAERLLSDFEESLSSLERTKAEAHAMLLQADVQLKKADMLYRIEDNELRDLRDQLSKCIIKAEKTGLVVYGSSNDRNPYRGGSQEPIQEGTTVRERQLIITIPDMTRMSVTVKVHEASIKSVAKGQRASIIIDSQPESALVGEVTKVGVLPNSGDRWMNPDIKLYDVEIRIEGIREWLRPGMSAEVTILVEEHEDVVYIPLQAVSAEGDQRYCFVSKDKRVERRTIVTGAFTEDFIEVVDGIEEGEIVFLRNPNVFGDEENDSNEGGGEAAA